jgi:general secretion pathway protein I
VSNRRARVAQCGFVDPAPSVASPDREGPKSEIVGGAQHGFSLLEVLVAFSVLALSLGLLIQVFSRALTSTALSATYSRATAVAESRLNAVGIDIPLEAGVHGGEPEDGLAWELLIEPYEIGDQLWELPAQPYLVTAVVTWETAQGERRIALTTLRLGELP